MHHMNQMHQFLELAGRQRQGKINMGDGEGSRLTRKSVSLPEELWDAIIDIQHLKRMKTQTSALEWVVRSGLRTLLREGDSKENRRRRRPS
jgi:hypothetical protein